MEVVVQNPTLDKFNFTSSPYSSAPSSPKRFGDYYLSAPTSPTRISQLYNGEFVEYSDFDDGATNNDNDDDDDGGGGDDGGSGFAFSVSCEWDESSLTAEELFDGGKIKPMKPDEGNELLTTDHDEAEEGNNKVNLKALSQKKKKKNESQEIDQQRRGRNKAPMLISSNSGRRATRSHSPYRTSNHTWQEQEQEHSHQQQKQTLTNKDGSTLTSSSSNISSKGSSSKRWRSLKDLLLFRSVSEGRGSTKDSLNSVLHHKKREEISKTLSFRDTSVARRKGHVSPHELHYTMKRAESEDMKKKTFLPYKQGILGRLSGFGI